MAFFAGSALQRRRDLGGEIGRRFVDAIAESAADEADNLNRRPGGLAAASTIADTRLLLSPHRRRPDRAARSLRRICAAAPPPCGRRPRRPCRSRSACWRSTSRSRSSAAAGTEATVEVLRIGGRDMQCDLPARASPAPRQRPTTSGRPARRSCRGPAPANCAYRTATLPCPTAAAPTRRSTRFSPMRAIEVRSVRPRRCGRCRDTASASAPRHRRLPPTASSATVRTNVLEASLRATKSVSELTSTTAPAVAARGDADQPFGRDAAGLFRGGGQPLLTQPIDGAFDLAAGLARAPACNPSCRRRSSRAVP